MCVNCNNNACGGCQPKIPQGLPGVNGKNAYTFTADTFTVPAISSNVTITVQNTGQFSNQWAVPGQIIYIDGAGYYQVVSKTGNNQITVTNLGYAGNAAQSTLIAISSGVSPSGLIGTQGPAGANGANGTTSIFADTQTYFTPNINTPTTLQTVTIPANTWVNYSATNADSILINASYSIISPITLNLGNAILNNTSIYIGLDQIFGVFTLTNQGKINATIKLTKNSSNSLFASNVATYQSTSGNRVIAQSGLIPSALNFAAPINIDFKITQTKALNIEISAVTIEKITA